MARFDNIGLVAIGRNEGQRLVRCLQSVPAGVSTVYVDSCSSDGSAARARSLGVVVVELDRAAPLTAARARNAGRMELLRARPLIKYVQFIDGDCEVEPGWLAAAADHLDTAPVVAAVCGRRRERYPERSIYNRLCEAEQEMPPGEIYACDNDVLFRSSALAQVAGFASDIIAGETAELCYRLRGMGWRMWQIDAPMTVHDARLLNVRQWWQRAVRIGYGQAQSWHRTLDGFAAPLFANRLVGALLGTFGIMALAVAVALRLGPAGLLAAPLLWLALFLATAWRRGFRPAACRLIGRLAETIGLLGFAADLARGRRPGAWMSK